MKQYKCHTLIIDEDFKKLNPPMPEDEYNNLVLSIRKNGCPRPIQIWRKILLTDFTYYDICNQYNIPFQIERLSFTTRADAIFYSCKQLSSTRNLSKNYVRYIVGTAYFAAKEILHSVSKGLRENPFPNHYFYTSKPYERPNRSAIVIANSFSVTSGSAMDYARFTAAINKLYSKSPFVAKDIMQSDPQISMKNVIVLSYLPIDKISLAYNQAKNNSDYSLFKEAKENVNVPSTTTPLTFNVRTYAATGPGIKKMPKYDPDAELSSLSFTIPSWISSMDRTLNVADFTNSSYNARIKLLNALNSLSNTIILLKDKIEETQDDL